MNSTERVTNVILGKPVDRQPIYGWVIANLEQQINETWGSAANFEDHYEFDAAHIFGGPAFCDMKVVERLIAENGEATPDMLLEEPDFFLSPDNHEEYRNIEESVKFHKQRGRFCYVQTPGFTEPFNGVFGIENHLLYMAMYPDELDELYARLAEWTLRFIDHCVECGVDMIHFSDDWGSQNSLLFNPKYWWEHVFPYMKKVVDYAHSKGVFASLHSDGCVASVADGIAEIGFDVVHPWQENAGMGHDLYLEKYADKFAILGGICVQSAIGILPQPELEAEIRRVFANLKGKRWICCTSHFVQDHCTMEDLTFAYDLIYKLARE